VNQGSKPATTGTKLHTKPLIINTNVRKKITTGNRKMPYLGCPQNTLASLNTLRENCGFAPLRETFLAPEPANTFAILNT
jgi:hypothetical protein